jgi:DNA-binding NtrC family response regulator
MKPKLRMALAAFLLLRGFEDLTMLEQALEQVEQMAEPGEEAAVSTVELSSLRAARRQAVDRFEVEYLQAILRKSKGNVTKAAAIAEVSRQVIHKLIAKHQR